MAAETTTALSCNPRWQSRYRPSSIVVLFTAKVLSQRCTRLRGYGCISRRSLTFRSMLLTVQRLDHLTGLVSVTFFVTVTAIHLLFQPTAERRNPIKSCRHWRYNEIGIAPTPILFNQYKFSIYTEDMIAYNVHPRKVGEGAFSISAGKIGCIHRDIYYRSLNSS